MGQYYENCVDGVGRCTFTRGRWVLLNMSLFAKLRILLLSREFIGGMFGCGGPRLSVLVARLYVRGVPCSKLTGMSSLLEKSKIKSKERNSKFWVKNNPTCQKKKRLEQIKYMVFTFFFQEIVSNSSLRPFLSSNIPTSSTETNQTLMISNP